MYYCSVCLRAALHVTAFEDKNYITLPHFPIFDYWHFTSFYISKLSAFNDSEGLMNIEIEYERIQETIHTEPIRYAGTLQHNRQKNRFHNVIPCELMSNNIMLKSIFWGLFQLIRHVAGSVRFLE